VGGEPGLASGVEVRAVQVGDGAALGPFEDPSVIGIAGFAVVVQV
jgi:hypothetical protein